MPMSGGPYGDFFGVASIGLDIPPILVLTRLRF